MFIFWQYEPGFVIDKAFGTRGGHFVDFWCGRRRNILLNGARSFTEQTVCSSKSIFEWPEQLVANLPTTNFQQNQFCPSRFYLGSRTSTTATPVFWTRYFRFKILKTEQRNNN